jgi:hypothetical protein
MRSSHHRSWPAFAAVAVIAAVGLFVLHGVAAGVALFVALLGFIITCIRALAGEKVRDGVGGIGGPFGNM